MLSSNLNKIKRAIKKANTVSFDIFDTLVCRPFATPSDLFKYIEEKENKKGFYAARIKAEEFALKNTNSKEVTIDEIYQNIKNEYRILKDIELNFEKKLIRPISGAKKVLEFAKNLNKEIIFTSDTYLSESFIKEIIYDLFEITSATFYISSTFKKTKRDGSLFKEIKKDRSKILHIGDNAHSDIKMAKSNGIKTFHIKRPKSSEDNIDKSILSGMCSNFKGTSFWETAGFSYAGPIAWSFALWIAKKAKENNIDTILLIARDGYFIEKILKKYFPELKAHYIYANRAVISQNKNLYKNLLNKPVIMVDVGTNNFTSQKFLQNMGGDILGLYWCTGSSPNNIKHEKFYQGDYENEHPFMGTGAIEFFLSAPTPPIKNLKNDKPIYSNPAKAEKIRIAAISEMEKGIMHFCDDVYSLFGTSYLNIKAESLIDWNNIWLTKPNKEHKKYFGMIEHASNQGHTEYEKQFKFK